MLLLDEPLAALDKQLRAETQFELMELQRKLGTTFVIVTHDQEEAMIVADRIAVMNQGRLMQVATPTEIYEQPNSRWVADFIGEVTIIEGQDDRARLDRQRVGDRWRSPIATTGAGKTVWLALRPEKIGMSGQRPAGEKNTVAGTFSRSAIAARCRPTRFVFRRFVDESLNRQRQCARPARHTPKAMPSGCRGRRTPALFSRLTMQGDRDTRGWGRRVVILVPYLLAGDLLPGAVRDRAQDQPVAVGARAAALYAGA